MRTAAAWSFPCGGCFLWAGGGPYELRLPRLPVSAAGGRVAAPSIRCALLAYRWPRPQQLLAASAAGGARRRCSRLRCCSNPPAYVSLTFAQKKTASVSLHQRFFHGRGWTTQAAHLKRPRRGLFAAGTYSGGRCCSNPPLRRFTNFRIKQKLQCHYNTGVLGGRGWIRTTEAEKQQIYSLSPLATREHAHILFVSVAGRLA